MIIANSKRMRKWDSFRSLNPPEHMGVGENEQKSNKLISYLVTAKKSPITLKCKCSYTEVEKMNVIVKILVNVILSAP